MDLILLDRLIKYPAKKNHQVHNRNPVNRAGYRIIGGPVRISSHDYRESTSIKKRGVPLRGSLFLVLYIEDNFEFEGFGISFLSFVVSPKFIKTYPLDIPGHGVIPIQRKCPRAGR